MKRSLCVLRPEVCIRPNDGDQHRQQPRDQESEKQASDAQVPARLNRRHINIKISGGTKPPVVSRTEDVEASLL
jgi:hypothetical protein